MEVEDIRHIEPGQKTACVVRYGAWGDAVLVAPVLEKLKKDGYHITLNCTERTYDVLKLDPNIDCFVKQRTDEVDVKDLPEYWKLLEPAFDRFINLTGSIEGSLLVYPGQPDYLLDRDSRHAKCNANYNDHTMACAGYPEQRGVIPKLYFKAKEEEWAKEEIKATKAKFVVLWTLTGSSIHKIYPYADACIQALVEGLEDAAVILVGEGGCKGLVTPHPRIFDRCGDFGIRKSFALAKHVSLVVSPETSVVMAAGCFDTPKIVMLSHASEENLTKYWTNTTALFEPKLSCYPCHKLHYERATCNIEEETGAAKCAALLHPERVMNAIEEVYMEFQKNQKVPS